MPNRRITLDLATVLDLGEKVKTTGAKAMELKLGLYATVLRAIADKTCADSEACAAAALEAGENTDNQA